MGDTHNRRSHVRRTKNGRTQVKRHTFKRNYKIKENRKAYMFRRGKPERSDSVLYDAYMKEEQRSKRARAIDIHKPNPKGKTFTREQVRDDPELLEKWMEKPNKYDIVGVDSKEPKRFVGKRGELVFHGTKQDSLIKIIESKELRSDPDWRIKGSGLTKEKYQAQEFGDFIIEFDVNKLRKKNELIEIKYDEQWFQEHPEYARRVVNISELTDKQNPTKELSKKATLEHNQEKEITSRKPIRFSFSDIRNIYVTNEKEFKTFLEKTHPQLYFKLRDKIKPLE